MLPRRHVSAMLLRHLRNINATRRDFSWINTGRLRVNRRQLGNWNDNLRELARICTRQFEFIIAQRVRRNIQICQLYTRLWNRGTLREFLRACQSRITVMNRRQLLVTSVFVTSYNWDKQRISDQEMYSYSNDLNKIYKLKDETVICSKCHSRIIIDIVQPDIEYCKCKDVKCKSANDPSEWEPFIERKDMLVWRRVEPDSNGLYAYKVYGSFNDVSAEDFLQVQIDVDYRKEWDETAKELTIVETDPACNEKTNGTSDIIYWEMIWPMLFANRDYVYQRKWIRDKEKGVIIIISKVTEHPDAPVRPGCHRVSSYWSYMIIKPYREFNESGIEFSLTYFDDPGISIPSGISSWVAMSGFPDYLCKMREATKHYKSYKSSKEHTIVSNSKGKEDFHDLEHSVLTQRDDSKTTKSANVEDNIVEEQQESKQADENEDEEEKESDSESVSESSDAVPDDNQGFLSYFFITRLFA